MDTEFGSAAGHEARRGGGRFEQQDKASSAALEVLKTCVGCLKWSLSLAFVSLEVKRNL